jgi:hypothetical protein
MNAKVLWGTFLLTLSLAAPLAATPVYTVNSGSISLVADFANTLFDVVVGAPNAVVDVSAPAVGQLLAFDQGTNVFWLTNLASTEAAQITVDFNTRILSPTTFVVSGSGIPLTGITDLALGASLQPLTFTFDLISFDVPTSVGLYSLNNFETVNAPVPEPATTALVGLGMALVAGRRLLRGRR